MVTVNKPVRKPEFDILEYWRIIWKRKWTIVSAAAVMIGVFAIYSFTTTPIYQATTTLVMEEPSSNRLTIQDVLSTSSGGNVAIISSYFNTQLKILQSRLLAERVAKKMNLGRRAELQSARKSKESLIQMIQGVLRLRWLFPSKAVPPSGPSPEVQADPDSAYATFVLGGLAVRQVPDTHLVDLGFRSQYPRLATDIVNAMADEFIDFSMETRYEATEQTKQFLDDQIARLREDLGTKEREMQKYSEEKKILQFSGNQNSVLSKFGDLQKAATGAQVERLNVEANYRELRSLNIDSLPQVINNGMIQGLKTVYMQLKADYDEKSRTTYKPDHPDMVQLKIRLDNTRTQLDQEIKKALDAAESAFRTTKDKEDRLRTELESQRVEVAKTNNDSILYKSLEMEVENIQTILNTLVSEQNKTQVSARLGGLKTSNIKVLDRALIPQSPVSPNKKRNLIVGFLLGFFFGIGLAFLTDFLDNTVKGPEDLERLTNLPSLGIIPHFSPNGTKEKSRYYSAYSYRYRSSYSPKAAAESSAELSKISEIELINHLFPKISIAEDYRTVRTAILFSHAENPHRVLTFTSTSPQEGKSATISNIAISFAQLGERVLLIDADLRKPRLHKIFKVRNKTGLADYLTARAGLDDAVQKTAIDNLWLMPSGPHPPNPAELLNSRKMKELVGLVQDRFATVLIDTPPVLAVIDPVIVSSLSDMTVLVMKLGTTTRKPLLRTIEELRKAKAEIIGVVLNDAKLRRNGFGSSNTYFQYEYYQDKSVDDEPAKKAVRRHA